MLQVGNHNTQNEKYGISSIYHYRGGLYDVPLSEKNAR